MVQIGGSDDLKLKLGSTDAGRKPTSFLFGAPFSLDRGLGVPGVGPFLDIVRQRVAKSGDAVREAFERELTGASAQDQYQRAMGFVYRTLGADAVADIVREGVLRARKPGATPLDPATEFDGRPDDWELTRGQLGLARVIDSAPTLFPGPVFTTNFDPLIELALRKHNFGAKTDSIHLDGSIDSPVKSSMTEIDVFHLHGFWRQTATLHMPQQLEGERTKLLGSLQRHLNKTHLVVMAYGGWDDIFTTAIANCLNDAGFSGEVSWCFYGSDRAAIEAENAVLFDKFHSGTLQGRIAFYCGIDCHTFFDDLGDALGVAASAASATDTSPIPGWQLVTSALLDAEPVLTEAEAVRYFDGAVPTLRHAISPLVPRLNHADELIARLDADRSTGCGMQLLRAAGGEGKSTALLQVAAHAARSGDWTVLHRPTTDAGLNPDAVAALDPAQQWLIVADDAEGLIGDIAAAADRLHRAGRTNVFFLLAARDTDWRAKGGDTKPWATRLNKLEDLVLGRIGQDDAALVVDAWAQLGDDGLRSLKTVAPGDRVTRFLRATKDQGVKSDEGSFFGALLDTRFGAAGLVEHLLPLLEMLRTQPIQGGTATLFDALVSIANCHATGMPGLDGRVLAAICGVQPYLVSSTIVIPLGKEVGVGQSRGHVLTRHKLVAEAVVVAAARLGADLERVWSDLVRTTVQLRTTEHFDPHFFNYVLHSGTKLMRDLPQVLDESLRADIAIAAAEADVQAEPGRISPIVDLAGTLRMAHYPQEAFDRLKDNFKNLPRVSDKENIRGFYFEWGACAGNLRGRDGAIMGAWLAACSLSDSLPFELTADTIMRACNGLGAAYRRLVTSDPNGVFAKGRRAVVHLGSQTNPDARAKANQAEILREVDALGTPKPKDNAEAIIWLIESTLAAWEELADPYLKHLKSDGRLSFERLRQVLAPVR